MRIRDKIDKKKLSHCMFNDEEIVCMNKKYFNDNYISKDKIKEKIKDLKNNLKSKEEQNEYFETLAKIEILEELLRW